ncbi:MAG: pyridoxal-phosphate dependent enzyme [Nitrososphaeria archaeon]
MTNNILLKCTGCGAGYNFDINRKLCSKCGNGLTIEIKQINDFEPQQDATGIWKYTAILPSLDGEFRISLGEGNTTLHVSKKIKDETRISRLWLKDETVEPTGSYLDRSSALFASMALQLRCRNLVTYSTGNLGASLSAYSSKAGLMMKVCIKPGIDLGKLYQMIAYGAEVRVVQSFKEKPGETGDTAVATEYDPLINEAKKTIMWEIFYQLNRTLPDYIILPMGEGGLVYSTFKALNELKKLNRLTGCKTKIIGVQPDGCAPIVEAFQKGLDIVEPLNSPRTKIFDLNVTKPRFGNAALKAIRETGGSAIAISESEVLDAMNMLAEGEGVLAEPAASLTIAGLIKLRNMEEIKEGSNVVCVITGSGLKDSRLMREIALRRSNLGTLIEELSGGMLLGDTKAAILKSLSEKEKYGYQIWKELREKHSINVKIPTVYQHLSKLTKEGYVEKIGSKMVLGRKREFYTLTDKGRAIT